MSRKAFGARRVTRSLEEIVKYLDEGVKVAGGITPGQTVRLDLEPSPISLSPRVKKVIWEETNSSVITLGQGKTTKNLVISGDDLENTQVFKLVPEDGSPFFDAASITKNTKTGFTATVPLIDPPPVSYHAFVVNDVGQTFLLSDACSIKAPASQPKPGLQLGAVVPNISFPGDDKRVTVLRLLTGTSSDVSKVYVTDKAGNKRNWRIEILDIAGVKTAQTLKPLFEGEVVFLSISVPKSEATGVYVLVAESASLSSEDKLAFYVLDPW